MLLVLPLAAGCGSTGGGTTADSAITPKAAPPGPPTSAPVGFRATASKQDPSVQAVVNNVQVNLNPGWNGVGFQCQQVTALNPGAGITTLAAYSNNAYTTSGFDTAGINAGTEKARRGFFVFVAGSNPTSFTYSGNDDGLGNFVNLQAGYNLVSFCVSSDLPGSQITASVNGQTVPLNQAIVPTIFEIQPDNSYVSVDISGSGVVKPGRAYWVFATAASRLNLPGGQTGLVVTPSGSVSTVVGAQIAFTGTFNGQATNLTIQTGNAAIAAVNGSTLQGVSVGVTNYTASANGTTVSGNITVQNGSLQGTLILNPGTATTVSEGEQRQFSAFAQFATSGNGTVQADVTNQCVWLVSGDAQNRGDVISLDSGAGLFTATRGNAGVVQVGAIYSTVSAVATANTAVTINRTNPTIQIRPAGGTETNNARVPGGGWSRLFEAVAVYPSGFSKVLAGNDVSWTNSSSPTVAALNAFNNSAGNTGRAELVTSSVPGVGQVNLTATYTNSASGIASGNHTVGIISYTLLSTAAAFAPTLPSDKMVIPGPGYVRPVTVTATFTDKNNASSNLVMPLFTNPAANNIRKAGAISLYLNPGVGGSQVFPTGQRNVTDGTVQLLTSAISAVGYTHLLRNTTTTLYNQNVLNVRVQYHPTTTAGSGFGTLSNTSSEITGTSTVIGGDRDVARTGQMSGVTVDGASSFQASLQTPMLRRGTGTNATLNVQYVGVGGSSENVTNLADWYATGGGAANIRVGNVTNNIGEVKARVLNQAPNTGTAGTAVVSAKYPRFAPGGDTANTTVTLTLP